MDKKFQKFLLGELYKYYPDYSREWIDRLSIYGLDLPNEKEIEKEIEYLRRKWFIVAVELKRSSPKAFSMKDSGQLEEFFPPHTGNLKITEKGIDYLEKLRTTPTLTSTEKENIMKAISPSIDKIWDEIQKDEDINKRAFGKKIDFVKDEFKRTIIFRDIAHAYILAKNDFSKPAVILAGGVIEELLRLYLKHKKIKPSSTKFSSYIKTCKDNGLLKKAISNLTDSFHHFRNIVHLKNEKTKRETISKATAKGAVLSIFSLANDFH